MTWRWRGLCQKEWMLMRWQVIGFFIMNLIIGLLSVAPLATGAVTNMESELNSLHKMWLVMHMVLGPILIFTSLEQDKKQPDVWFHSPSSMWQIIGVKVFMTTMIVFGSLVVSSLMVAVAYYAGPSMDTVPIVTAGVLTASLIVTALVNAVFNIVATLFIWVLIQYFNLRIGWLSSIAVLIPFYVIVIIWGVLTSVFPESATITLKSLLVFGLFSMIFFCAGTLLLDKKVRY